VVIACPPSQKTEQFCGVAVPDTRQRDADMTNISERCVSSTHMNVVSSLTNTSITSADAAAKALSKTNQTQDSLTQWVAAQNCVLSNLWSRLPVANYGSNTSTWTSNMIMGVVNALGQHAPAWDAAVAKAAWTSNNLSNYTPASLGAGLCNVVLHLADDLNMLKSNTTSSIKMLQTSQTSTASKATFASNTAAFGSNTAAQAIELVNQAQETADAASETAAYASNVADFASNLAVITNVTANNALTLANLAGKTASWGSNTSFFASNLATRTSNVAYKASTTAGFASNAAIYGSNTANQAITLVQVASNAATLAGLSAKFASNTSIFASNLAVSTNITASNALYIAAAATKTGVWASNTSFFASNLATRTSNVAYKANATAIFASNALSNFPTCTYAVVDNAPPQFGNTDYLGQFVYVVDDNTPEYTNVYFIDMDGESRLVEDNAANQAAYFASNLAAANSSATGDLGIMLNAQAATLQEAESMAEWGSNTAYYASNVAFSTSNVAFWGSNTSAWTSNQLAAYTPMSIGTWASNAAGFSSNSLSNFPKVRNFTSPIVPQQGSIAPSLYGSMVMVTLPGATQSNVYYIDMSGVPRLVEDAAANKAAYYASNAVATMPNLTTTLLNYTPLSMGKDTSNVAYTTSNYIFTILSDSITTLQQEVDALQLQTNTTTTTTTQDYTPLAMGTATSNAAYYASNALQNIGQVVYAADPDDNKGLNMGKFVVVNDSASPNLSNVYWVPMDGGDSILIEDVAAKSAYTQYWKSPTGLDFTYTESNVSINRASTGAAPKNPLEVYANTGDAFARVKIGEPDGMVVFGDVNNGVGRGAIGKDVTNATLDTNNTVIWSQVSSLQRGGDIVLSTSATHSTSATTPNPTERMRVTNSGLVGIGVKVPTNKLTVNGGDIAVNNGGNSANAGGAIMFGTSFGENKTYTQKMAYIKGVLSSIDQTNLSEIGGLAFYTRDGFSGIAEISPEERMRITPGGFVGIGTTSPGYQLTLSTDSAGKPGSTTWTNTSDERIKENIVLADLDICYSNLKNIPLKYYKWRDDIYTDEEVNDRHKLGWIAQDVEGIFPKAVTQSSMHGYDDLRSLQADQIYATLYGAVQKLQQVSERQSEQLASLTQQLQDAQDANQKMADLMEQQSQMISEKLQALLSLQTVATPVADEIQAAPEAAPEVPEPTVEAAPEAAPELTEPTVEAAPEVPEPTVEAAPEAAPEVPEPTVEAAPEVPEPTVEAAPELTEPTVNAPL
jgi:hypothetical protein